MALRDKQMFKTVLGNTDLELTAEADESFLVKNILIDTPASAHITVKVSRKSVGYFRVSGELGSHLAMPGTRSRHAHDLLTTSQALQDQTSFATIAGADAAAVAAGNIGGLAISTLYKRFGQYSDREIPGYKSILQYLMEMGMFEGFPVPAGHTLVIEGAAQAGAVQVVEYERYDPGDITADMPNGHEAKEYMFINYGNSGAAITAQAENHLDTPVNPAEFLNFPFGAVVPGNHEIDLLGILASAFAPGENDGTDGIGTKYLKLIKNRDVLFDQDLNGLLMYADNYGDALVGDYVGEGQAVVHNYSDEDFGAPFMLGEPMTFLTGDELVMYLETIAEGAGQTISLAEQEVGVILKVRELGA